MRQFGKGIVVTKCSAFTNHSMHMCRFGAFAEQRNGGGSREKDPYTIEIDFANH
jgi:hypothetical protein